MQQTNTHRVSKRETDRQTNQDEGVHDTDEIGTLCLRTYQGYQDSKEATLTRAPGLQAWYGRGCWSQEGFIAAC